MRFSRLNAFQMFSVNDNETDFAAAAPSEFNLGLKSELYDNETPATDGGIICWLIRIRECRSPNKSSYRR